MPSERSSEHTDGWDVYRVIEALRRRVGLVVLCIVLVPLAALGLSLAQQKQYTATIAILFRNPGLDQEILGHGNILFPPIDADQEAATNLRLVDLDTVDRLVGGQLGLSQSDVRGKIDVQAQGNSNIVTVSATDPSPQRAANIANVFGQQFIAFRRDADRAKINQATILLQNRINELPPGGGGDIRRSLLENRLTALETLADLQTGNAEVVQPADVPTSPSSPKIVRNTVIGGLIGVLLALALALILDRLDRRVREPDELEDIFDLPIVGYVPESGSLRKEDAGPQLRGPIAEAFRMMRTTLLYFNVDKNLRSLLVTSAAPKEGKTTVSLNLACTAAAGGGKVLLLEADLRHPALRKHIRDVPDGTPGLGEIIARDLDLHSGVTRVPLESTKEGRPLASLDVILAGPVPPNPADLLESQRMRMLIQEAERDYDLVVIDTPPTFVVPDAVPLVNQVSGVIVVARLGVTMRDTARKLREQLDNLNAPTLGLVVNSVDHWRTRYGYLYESAVSANGGGESGDAKPRRRWLRRTDGGEGAPSGAGDEQGSPESKKGAPPS
ncbi:MAG: polysaccharide biosynthesis tyrosine autokinase [Solirubrobacterales bacterium]